MRETVIDTVSPPGLNEYKQVELFTKYRKLIDPEYWNDTCPEPSKEVMEKIASEKKDKSKKRQVAKKLLV